MSENIPKTKVQLLRHLSYKLDISQTKAGEVIEELVHLAYAGAGRRGGFSIPGLGKVVLSQHKARIGYNLHTGEQIAIPGKKALRFVFSVPAKRAVLGTEPRKSKASRSAKTSRTAPAKKAAKKGSGKTAKPKSVKSTPKRKTK